MVMKVTMRLLILTPVTKIQGRLKGVVQSYIRILVPDLTQEEYRKKGEVDLIERVIIVSSKNIRRSFPILMIMMTMKTMIRDMKAGDHPNLYFQNQTNFEIPNSTQEECPRKIG